MAFSILETVAKTRRIEAPKFLLTGEQKIGKSTFAASAPNSIGICTEDGMAGIDAQAFPICQTLDDVYKYINGLSDEEHGFSSLFLDSLDWLEPLLQSHVCKANGWPDIESAGYGKGYVAAATEWRKLLDLLEKLRVKRRMAVILICHVKQTRIESPIAEAYDGYTLKLNQKASSLVSEWVDIIGFAAQHINLKKPAEGFGAKKALKHADRVLHLEAHPAYPSGNRFGLLDCKLDWSSFAQQLTNAQT